jgi:PE family
MSYVITSPEIVTTAATRLANVGSTISEANAAATAPITGVLAAGTDEVSMGVAALFSGHAQAYQALSTQAAAFHAQFVQALDGAGASYASAEAANASPLQEVLNAINAPTQALFGRPRIGNGSNGAAGSCTATAATAGPAAPPRPAVTAGPPD